MFVQKALQTSKLPVAFQSFPSSMAMALALTCPGPTATLLIDVECFAPVLPNINVMIDELPSSSQVPNVTLAVAVHKRGLSSTTARSPSKRYLETTTKAKTAVLNYKDV